MSQPTRTYTNGEVTVEWRPELCIHCRKCVEGLPQVFDLDKKPWVNIHGATSAEIRKQVAQCPNGALAMGK
jgi:putative redox protein